MDHNEDYQRYPYNLACDIFYGEYGKLDKVLPEYLKRMIDQVLSARELKCVYLKYIDGKSFKEIGSEFCVTPERIQYIIGKALWKLRQPDVASQYIAVRLCDVDAQWEQVRIKLLGIKPTETER